MSRRTSAVLAWSLVAASAALSITAMWLAVVHEGDVAFTVFVIVLAAIPFPLIGALIASRFPSNAIGWIFVAVGLLQALNVFGSEYARYTLVTDPGSLPFARIAAVVALVAWMPSLALLTTFLLLLFPDGRLPSPGWRWVAWLSGTGIALVLIGAGGGAWTLPTDALVSEAAPLPTWGAGTVAVGAVMVLVGAVASVTSLVLRFRRSRGDERQQLKWMAFAGVFAFVIIAVQFLPLRLPLVLEVLMGLALLAIPTASAIAILRYRLYDIDVVINKTVVYGALAAFVTVVYVGIVVGIGALVGSRGSVFLTILATAIIALAFQPARVRARHFANRLVYGKRATPYEILSQLAQGMGALYSADDALPSLARVLGEGTGAAHAGVWLRVGGELRRGAAWPVDETDVAPPIPLTDGRLPPIPEAQRALPVTHEGELLGALAVSMPRGEAVTPATEKLLGDVASQTALVLRNVRLIEELRASRQRLVTAQDEERRRLERNIHDGAQQQLVSLAVKMRLAEGLTRKDPERAAELMAQVRTETQAALEDLRDLARGIYPPLLADKGLAAALEAQARRAALPVLVESNGLGRYSPDAEATAYFCVLEALQNAAKYAEATSATVRLAREDHHLVFSVSDDGKGFDPESTPRGTGLQNMADRLEALGGSLSVESSPGRGTIIAGRIPAVSRDAST